MKPSWHVGSTVANTLFNRNKLQKLQPSYWPGLSSKFLMIRWKTSPTGLPLKQLFFHPVFSHPFSSFDHYFSFFLKIQLKDRRKGGMQYTNSIITNKSSKAPQPHRVMNPFLSLYGYLWQLNCVPLSFLIWVFVSLPWSLQSASKCCLSSWYYNLCISF